VANHRAERRTPLRRSADGPTSSQPGRRKAVKAGPRVGKDTGRALGTVRSAHAGSRKKLLPGLPSAPTLVGAAALALAATGAVTITQQGDSAALAAGDLQRLSRANALSGVSSTGPSMDLSGRHLALSRDSQRQALQEAADEELQAAAEAQARQRNAALAELAASAEKHADALARNAWHLPVAAGAYRLTATFGQCSWLWSHCHTGLDFAAPSGTPIMAIAGGVVTEVGYSGAYGNRTIITLEDGSEMWYCHQTSYTVSVGETVSPGEQIGYVGSSGNVTSPHPHQGIRPGAGDPTDPYAALLVHGIQP
jgi:biotin carboxyl carrier protein